MENNKIRERKIVVFGVHTFNQFYSYTQEQQQQILLLLIINTIHKHIYIYIFTFVFYSIYYYQQNNSLRQSTPHISLSSLD